MEDQSHEDPTPETHEVPPAFDTTTSEAIRIAARALQDGARSLTTEQHFRVVEEIDMGEHPDAIVRIVERPERRQLLLHAIMNQECTDIVALGASMNEAEAHYRSRMWSKTGKDPGECDGYHVLMYFSLASNVPKDAIDVANWLLGVNRDPELTGLLVPMARHRHAAYTAAWKAFEAAEAARPKPPPAAAPPRVFLEDLTDDDRRRGRLMAKVSHAPDEIIEQIERLLAAGEGA